MNIFVVLALAMLLIIVALRKKVPIGPAILAGGLLIWVAGKPEIPLLGEAAKQMFTMQRTYALLFALYFVVCLEIELRKSGCLKGISAFDRRGTGCAGPPLFLVSYTVLPPFT